MLHSIIVLPLLALNTHKIPTVKTITHFSYNLHINFQPGNHVHYPNGICVKNI